VFYQLGVGYSLNDRVSLSTQLIGTVIGHATRDDRTIRRSDLDILSLQLAQLPRSPTANRPIRTVGAA
jgi:hypothetical protein